MHFDRTHTVAFTGHRTYCGEADSALRTLLEGLIGAGFDTFLSGMAQGFDLAAAEMVLDLQRAGHRVRLVAVIPHATQSSGFSAVDRDRFRRILAVADEVIILSPTYHRGCYRQRNNFLIDHSSHLVAWYNGTRGGTQYTFCRALKQGLTLHNLSPEVIPDPRLFE